MPMEKTQPVYIFISIAFHLLVFAILVFGFAFSKPLPVLEKTNKNDVINAIVLGDSPQSKILPQFIKPREIKELSKEKDSVPMEAKSKEMATEQEVIALKTAQKKKLEQQKAEVSKKSRALFAKDLLSDIKKETDKKKKLHQKDLRAQFEKTLREHAEKSLRQQLLNEDIHLQAKQSRQTQGEVNKYQALIVQAISERWLVPPGTDKKLYCQLMIKLAPSGNVLDVQIIKSSGDKALDSSARAAVLKASPLPVPSDKEAFNSFKQFVLKVRPENILANEGGMQ